MVYTESAEFDGKNLEDTIDKALKTLGRTRDEVKIDVLKDMSHEKAKFFGFSVKSVKIKVSYNAEQMEISDMALIGRDFLNQVLSDLDLNSTIESIYEDENTIKYILESENPKLVIGKRGVLLESLQAITYMIINKNKEKWKRILLDIDNYRKNRESKMEDMITDIAHNVRKSKRAYLTPPYSPYDRRIIHMIVQEINGVLSESEGYGLNKRVWIKPE